MNPKILFLSHNPHEAHLSFAKSVGAYVKILRLDFIVKTLKKFPKLRDLYVLVSFFYSIFIKSDWDVIISEGGSSFYVSVFLKARNPRIKIVFLDIDLFFYTREKGEHPKEFISKTVSLFYGRFKTIRNATKSIDAVLSVSEQNKEMASRHVNVPSEVTPPYPSGAKKWDIPRKNYGLYVGRLDEDKNIRRIVEFGIQCPYFEKFIILGDGTLRDYVESAARLNRKIVYLGYRRDVARFYSECRFLVHIPDWDPHPCTTMEAALCGCFPVISKGVGTKYLFDKHFITGNPDDFEDINNKIKYFLDNEGKMRRRLARISKKIPSKADSVNNFKSKFYDILKEIQ